MAATPPPGDRSNEGTSLLGRAVLEQGAVLALAVVAGLVQRTHAGVEPQLLACLSLLLVPAAW
ncbi:hypothetical protein OAX78_03295, partial [Planctomycetota bacterium]|nr:hypothetical protein [Planctomycetota bacterium]